MSFNYDYKKGKTSLNGNGAGEIITKSIKTTKIYSSSDSRPSVGVTTSVEG